MERMNYPTAHIVGPDAPAYMSMGPSPISLEDGRHSAQVDVDQQLVVGHLSIIQLPLDLYIHYRGPLAAEFAKLYENQTFGRLEQLLWKMAGVVMQADPRESLLRFANPLMRHAGECARKQIQSTIRRELGIKLDQE